MWSSLGTTAAELRIDRTLMCGQAFRWKLLGESTFAGVLAQNLVVLKQTDSDVLYRFPGGSITKDKGKALLADYFQLDVSLDDLYREWRRDKNFAEKVDRQGLIGLRVLRQDPVENVFSFICSSNNNISRISSMVNSLCSEFGKPIGSLETIDKTTQYRFYTFPSLESLAQDHVEKRLRELGFGYRAKFISQSARIILEKGGVEWLHSLRDVPYKEAHDELATLSGVGPKVADCICLMSMDKIGAIPVDTHVWQIAKRDYGFVSSSTKTITKTQYAGIGDSFRGVFGDYAGWAHTVLFAADLRSQKVEK
eukprot:jgi/Hompol1/6055/HPOL_000267-RA